MNSGDNLESERYLIMVEEAKMKEKSCGDQPRKAEIVDLNRRGLKPAVLPPRHLSVGLKRKFTVCLFQNLSDISIHFKTQKALLNGIVNI